MQISLGKNESFAYFRYKFQITIRSIEFCFLMFFETRDTPRISKPEHFQLVCRSTSAQVACGSEKEHIFANGFFTTLRATSAAKQN